MAIVVQVGNQLAGNNLAGRCDRVEVGIGELGLDDEGLSRLRAVLQSSPTRWPGAHSDGHGGALYDPIVLQRP